MARSVLAYVLVVAVAAACTQAAPKAADKRCTPGNYVFCRCKDRSEGTKLCNEDGDGFAPCEGCLSGSDGNLPGEEEPPPDEEPPPPPKKDAGTVEKDSSLPVDDAGMTPAPPKVNELFITEVMFDPSGPEPSEEWFEIFSIATQTVSLNGLLVRDGQGRTHGVSTATPVLLAPGAHKLFVRNMGAAIAAGIAPIDILFEYGTDDPDTGGVLLSNGTTGALSILQGATEIVKVPYGTFGYSQTPPGGSSIQLKVPDVAASKTAAGWCLSTVIWSGQPATKNPQDRGSPGDPSNCP